MTKRIWKKGSAEKKALAKSTSRMARDLIRVSDEKVGRAYENYFANKPKKLDKQIKLGRMIQRAMIRRGKRVREIRRESEHLAEQWKHIAKGMRDIKKTQERKNPVEALKRLRNSAEIVLNGNRETTKKSIFYEKNIPKKDAEEIIKRRKLLEKKGDWLVVKIATIDGKIAELERK